MFYLRYCNSCKWYFYILFPLLGWWSRWWWSRRGWSSGTKSRGESRKVHWSESEGKRIWFLHFIFIYVMYVQPFECLKSENGMVCRILMFMSWDIFSYFVFLLAFRDELHSIGSTVKKKKEKFDIIKQRRVLFSDP